jgi:hypothetical protein
VIRLLLAAFFLEAGVALLLVPWSSYWERNYFAEAVPWLHEAIANNFVRGAVSGLGLVNLAAGLVELSSLFASQRRGEHILSIGRSSAD